MAVADGKLSRRAGIDVARPHAVYISVQMLEKHSKNCHFRHFGGPAVRLAGGTARSTTRCSIMRSDITCTRPGHSKASGYRCIETATPIFAHCTLSQVAQNG